MSADVLPQGSLPQEWIRVNEAVTYSRLSKAALYNLINSGKIKSYSDRKRGSLKGVRLIFFDSLRNYLLDNCK